MSYVSQGTISVEFELNDADLRASLFFVPNCDYSIKHRRENYAVFVLEGEGENQDASIFKKIEERGVKITLKIPAVHVPPEETRKDELNRTFVADVAKSTVDRSSWITIMSGISERHSKVEIQVNENWQLTAIRAVVG